VKIGVLYVGVVGVCVCVHPITQKLVINTSKMDFLISPHPKINYPTNIFKNYDFHKAIVKGE